MKTPIQSRLAAVRRKLLVCLGATGVALVVITAVSALSIAMTLDWLVELPWLGRAVLLAATLSLVGFVMWRQLLQPLRQAPDQDGCALLVEQAQPEFRTRLISTIQLTRPGALQTGDSPAMLRVLVAQTEAIALPFDFTSVVNTRQAGMFSFIAALVAATASVCFSLAAPTSTIFLRRAFLDNIAPPHKTHIVVANGDRKVAQGDTVVIEALASGVIPPRGKLSVRYGGRAKQDFAMLPVVDQPWQFVQTIDNVQESFTYTVRLNDHTTAPFTITVLERPVVTGIDCQQIYPPYTKLGTVKRAVNDLALLAGSRLELRIAANKNIQQAALHLAGLNTEVPLEVDATDRRVMRGAVPVPQSGLTGFTVQLLDEDGLRSKEFALYRIDIQPDKPPNLVVTHPERKEELVTSRATAVIGMEAYDDFGVGKLLFHYRSPAIKGGKQQTVELDLGADTPKQLRRRHEWNLATVGDALPEETTIECWLEARDTNDATGPGIAQTEHFWLKVVSEEDKRADLINRLDDYLGRIGEVAEQQERLNQNLGSLIFERPPR